MNEPDTNPTRSICILPELKGIGGPASFQSRLIAGLQERGHHVHHNPLDVECDVILVNGGTRQVVDVLLAKQRGTRVVQRLAQNNWVYKARWTGLKHYLRSEINNRLLAFIRRGLASRVIYQSNFVDDIWNKSYGFTPAQKHIVYNGVDLNTFKPTDTDSRPPDHIRLLVVEGHLGTGHEKELENAIYLAEAINARTDQDVELVIAGDVPEKIKMYWQENSEQWISWEGIVSQEQIADLDRSAHLLFSSELNAGCPNAVLEALACGCPVIGFETGSLPELIDDSAGATTPYYADHWKLETPEFEPLAEAAIKIINEQDHYRAGARKLAEDRFNIENAIQEYLNILLD